MTDPLGRNIEYMRLSITDRCNLRCRYCMPHGVASAAHADILTYEEILRVCEAATSLGITRFKVTGGEPLVRRGAVDFIARLKALPRVQQVTLTTNGLLLEDKLDALHRIGIDGINISLDTVSEAQYAALTGSAHPAGGLFERLFEKCAALGIRTKVNSVLLEETFSGIEDVAAIAQRLPIDVRFIELMPIGEGAGMRGVPMEAALACLRERWPDLAPTNEKRGNGPARYYASGKLRGRIGFIDAVSHTFCADCNRVRLSSTGWLKPCICYEDGADLRTLLRGEAGDEELRAALREIIAQKPQAHCFSQKESITERRTMNQIGG